MHLLSSFFEIIDDNAKKTRERIPRFRARPTLRFLAAWSGPYSWKEKLEVSTTSLLCKSSSCLKPAQCYLQTLANDVQWKVRRTLASSIHEIAKILGENLTVKELEPIFRTFLSVSL